MYRTLTIGTAVVATVLTVAVPVARATGQEQLLTRDQALKEIFSEGTRTLDDTRTLSPAQRKTLERDLGRRIDDDELVVTRVFDVRDALRGYAVVSEEIGKYRPITFMVGLNPDFTVREVVVMVYRESRGGDVKRKRFLNQYRRKSVRDPIDVNRDIINISGATISVRSMNAGVKRILAEVVALYGPQTAR